MPRSIYVAGLIYAAQLVGGVEDPGFERINWGRTKYLGVEGALTYNDAMAIKAMAESFCLPDGGRLRYAESGSYFGLSATIVASACKTSIVYAHDIFPVEQADLPKESEPPPGAQHLLLRFYENVLRNGFEGRIIPLRGPSFETLQVHRNESLDLAFVDGDHSYNGALADMELMWTKVRQGGTLLVHDAITYPNGTLHPVRSAATDFVRNVGSRFFDVTDTWGLLAIFKGNSHDVFRGNAKDISVL